MTYQKEQFAKSYQLYAFFRGLNYQIENDIRQIINSNEIAFPGLRILWILYFDPNIRMKDLTKLIQNNISNIFRQVTKLVDDGLLMMTEDKDARIKKLLLTDKGKGLVEEFIRDNISSSQLKITQFIQKIPEEDFQKIIEVCKMLSNELIGEQYSKFIFNSSSGILNDSTLSI